MIPDTDFGEFSAEIKKHVSVSVVFTGGISDFETAKGIFADLIDVGRAFFKDYS